MATIQRSAPQPPVSLGDRPSVLKPENIAALHEIVAEHAQVRLKKLPMSWIAVAARVSTQRRFNALRERRESSGLREHAGCLRQPIKALTARATR